MQTTTEVSTTLQVSTQQFPEVDKDNGVTLSRKVESSDGVAGSTLLRQIFQPSINQTRSAWKSVEPNAVARMTHRLRCKTEYYLSIRMGIG